MPTSVRRISRFFVLPLALGAFALIGGCAGTPRGGDLPIEAADVYTGPEGLTLRVLFLRPKADGKLLIEVSKSGTVFDDKVLPYEREERGGTRTAWFTKHRGRGFYTFHQERRSNDVEPQTEVYLPGRRNATKVKRDEAQSQALKTSAIVALHRRQVEDGTVGNFAKFDRAFEQAEQDKELADDIEGMKKACGEGVLGGIEWASVTDAFMLEKSPSGWCEDLFSSARQLCERSSEARAALGKVKELRCRFVAEPPSYKAGGAGLLKDEGEGRFTFTVPDANVSDMARAALLAGFEVAGAGGAKLSLGRRVEIEETAVCTDGKSHFVVSGPHPQGRQLAYGDGKKLVKIAMPGSRVPSGYFLDPRNYNPKLNSNFWGLDLRVFSSVEVDEKTGACKVACGTRESTLQPVSAADKKALLTSVVLDPPGKRRAPYALARDTKGVYYLVDRTDEPEAKDFRLFVGPKGGLKPQQMTNVVSDSEGEVFSTKTGSLRFVLGKAEASWIAGKKNTKLLLVPVAENLPMIYNDLGLYTERLDTPCDDL